MHPDIRAELARDRQAQALKRGQAARETAADAPMAFNRLTILYLALRHRRREIATREQQASTSATR
jgi:hypothetical protein